jgi:hypothetical protein
MPPNDPKPSHSRWLPTQLWNNDKSISYLVPKLKGQWPLAPAWCQASRLWRLNFQTLKIVYTESATPHQIATYGSGPCFIPCVRIYHTQASKEITPRNPPATTARRRRQIRPKPISIISRKDTSTESCATQNPTPSEPDPTLYSGCVTSDHTLIGCFSAGSKPEINHMKPMIRRCIISGHLPNDQN